ncbi:MAG: major capsid protein, partial [Acutalibacteraceae bacterium]
TRIAQVIVPEVFNPYVVQRTMELSALVQSGIVENNAEFDRLASQGARTVNMPFWNDLTGPDELLDDQNPLTPGLIQAAQDEAVILRRGRAWGVNDLAANLAGDDPMRAIGDLVAAYWARRLQAILLAKLTGVFGAATMAGNVLDITNAAGNAANISAATFVDAAQRLGDAKEAITGVLMHSATEASLAKQDLIAFEKPSGGSVEVKTFLGKRVIVDDGCPVDAVNANYTTYLFGPGAIALGNGNPVGFVPTEVARDALAGEDFLVNRKTMILHPRGVRWTPGAGVPAGVSPSNAELAAGANWTRVYEAKAIRMVAFIHKIQ